MEASRREGDGWWGEERPYPKPNPYAPTFYCAGEVDGLAWAFHGGIYEHGYSFYVTNPNGGRYNADACSFGKSPVPVTEAEHWEAILEAITNFRQLRSTGNLFLPPGSR